MLALKSYEQNNGFSAMSTDELYFINGGSEGISFEDSSIKYSHNINENVSLNVSVGYSTSFSEESKPVSVSVGDDSLISATAGPFSVSIDSVSVGIKIKF